RRFFDPIEQNPHHSYNQIDRHDNKLLPPSVLAQLLLLFGYAIFAILELMIGKRQNLPLISH
ncbi:hypothetical protein ACPDME_002786, partial [Vibrio cholerae]